jgi:hypothetical protein
LETTGSVGDSGSSESGLSFSQAKKQLVTEHQNYRPYGQPEDPRGNEAADGTDEDA